MKRMRKIVHILVAIWIMVICLAGCTREVDKDSSNYAKVWYNEESINIYSSISSTVEVAITVEYSGKTITIGESVEIAEHQNKTIMVDDLNAETFEKNAKIVSAEIIRQTYKDMTIGYCIAIVFGLAVILPVLFFVFKIFFGILRFYLSFFGFFL